MEPTLDLVGLVVADMRESLRFYRLLGLPLPEGSEEESHVETITGGIRLAFDTVELVRSFSKWEKPTGSARVALAFRCDSPSHVDEVYLRMVDADYRSHLEPFDAFWGQRYAALLDPDDNVVDLFAPDVV